MIKRVLFTVMLLLLCSTVWAGQAYMVEVYPVTTTYERRSESGITVYQRTETSNRGEIISYSGSSNCQVIDLNDFKNIDGYFTFQFKDISGTTSIPMSNITISVHWKGSNIDSQAAWSNATENTIVNAISSWSGNTSVGYDMVDITGVTPFKYMRFIFESGASVSAAGGSGIAPIGVLNVR